MIDARKLTLSKLFPRKHLNLSVVLPQINFITLQVSAEQFSPSEQSSLSGQCGSKVSIDFDSSKNSCTTVLIASISKFQSMFISDDEDPSVQNAKLLILQRCSLFMSSKDLAILNSFQSDNQAGLNGRFESVHVQLQRLSHPRELRYANNVTAVKPCRSMVNFTLHRGEEADVDDLSWLEPRSSDPIGHIMMECGIEKVSISALERLQSLSSKESEDKSSVITASPDKLSPRVKSRSKASETGIQVTESKDSVSETGSTNKYEDPLVQREPGSVSLESPGIELTEIISSSPIPSPNLLKDQLEGDTDHFALGIDPKHDASGSLPSESDDAAKTLLKSSKKSKDKSSRKKSGKASKRGTEKDTSKLDVIEERSRTESTEEKEKFVLHSQKQGEITIKRVWFNLATPERLKVLQEGADHDVNLLTSLVPAVCSWIPAVVDLQRSVGLVKHSYRKWRYSVLACAMGQSLPENGRLLVKVCI